jgi:biopolymer transport protein ExbD
MLITRKRRIDAGIDMTPLIDVVFQLLIFLMVSSQFIKPDRRVDLPTGPVAAAPVSEELESLTLVILADNKLLLEGNPIELNALSDGLRDLVHHTDITSLEIKGDSTSHLGTFITVIETARECGIIDLGYHKKDASAK